MKSSSGPHRVPVSRHRTLKRGAYVRPAGVQDMPFLWAAYKKGAFYQIDDVISEDLTQEQFSAGLAELDRTTNLVIAVAPNTGLNGRTEVPVGLFSLIPRMPTVAEPHVIWFPWATPRNKIEATLRFLDEARKNVDLVLFTETGTERFWWRMVHYGVISRAGNLDRYFPGPAHIWSTRR